MSGVELDTVTEQDVHHVATHMRDADRREVWAAANVKPHFSISRSVANSEYSRVVRYDGEPCAIFGVACYKHAGSPWLLGTNLVLTRPRQFLQLGIPAVAHMLSLRPFLMNFVHTDNHASKRWLLRLGFVIDPAARYGVEGERFHRFTMERPDV